MVNTIGVDPSKLLIVKPPNNNESFQGYILRLANENRYEKVSWIYSLMAKINNFESNSSLIQEIEALAKITGLKQSHFQNILFRNLEQEKFEEFKSFILVSKCKICPKCLEEKGYYHGLWEISFITVCPEHQCLLIDNCPNCNQNLNWNRNNVFKCKCNFDLRNCNTLICNKNSLVLSSLIDTKMREQNIENGSGNPLFNLDVLSILKLIGLISLKIVFSIKPGGRVPFKKMENSELDNIINNAFETFNNWPNNFFRFLDDLKPKNIKDKKGISREFGSFYRSIQNYNQFEFLTSAFKYYVFLNKDKYLTQNFSKIFKEDFAQFNYIKGTEAAHYLGLKRSTVQKLIKMNILDGITNEIGQFTLSLVDIESAKKLKEKLKKWYTVSKTREYLNISETVFPGFFNLIEHIEIHYKSRGVRKLFNPEVVDNFFIEIDKKIRFKESKMISIESALKLINGILKGYSYGEIFCDIVQDKITPRGIDTNLYGIKRYLFCHEEIIEFAHRKLEKANVGSFSADITAKMLGVRLQDLRDLVKRGMIKNISPYTPTRFSLFEIDKFKLTYVDSKEIRSNYKFNFQPTVKKLIEKGVMPLMGPTIDGFRKYIFLRESVNRLSIK